MPTIRIVVEEDGESRVLNLSDLQGLPSGAATAAKQDTLIGHVDTLEAALAAILAELSQKLEPGGAVTFGGVAQPVESRDAGDDVIVTDRNGAGDITEYTLNGVDRVVTYDVNGEFVSDLPA